MMGFKKWVVVASSLFVIGIVFGLATPPSIVSLLSETLSAVQEKLGMIAGLPPLLMAIFIFANNAFTLLMSFILSPILCLVPVMSLTLNGWLMGFMSPVVVSEKSLGFLLAGLLPHGIFEIPALIMGEAAALSFGTMAIAALFNKENRELLLPSLKQNSRYLAIALALLLPAAIIETYLTPLILAR